MARERDAGTDNWNASGGRGLLAIREKIGAICRELGISGQSYYRWRREHGSLKVSQARRLKELEKENQRLCARLFPT